MDIGWKVLSVSGYVRHGRHLQSCFIFLNKNGTVQHVYTSELTF